MEEKKISLPVIKRLPRYYRYLAELLDNQVTRISSKELSQRMNITASQIRQDLNNFGCFGQQGYGYNVEFLYNEIRKILGLDEAYNLVIVGAGNIGQALVNYATFERRGFKIIGIFDANPRIIGVSIKELEVMDVQLLGEFIQKNKVDIGVLTLPKGKAIEVSEIFISNKVTALWNFTNTDLNAPPHVCIENVHLTDSLMTLCYKFNETKKTQS